MQAAGVLVYAPTNASYTWTLEQAADLWVAGGSSNTLTHLAKGTEVGSISSSATTKIAPSQSGTTGNYYGAIDASTFKPQTTGLYLFRRTRMSLRSLVQFELSSTEATSLSKAAYSLRTVMMQSFVF